MRSFEQAAVHNMRGELQMAGYRLTFIRHGETSGNAEGRYIGKTDLPLSERGSEEIYKISEAAGYPSFQRIYIPPLKRCLQTAYILSPDSQIVELAGLSEMDFGKFENKTMDELKDDPDYAKFLKGGLDNPPPGGESVRELISRCFEALNTILRDMSDEGLTNCAVVTHSGIIMNMLACFGLPKRRAIEYACGFGKGFTVLASADMWQRSGAFEIIDEFPSGERCGDYDDYDYSVEEPESDHS